MPRGFLCFPDSIEQSVDMVTRFALDELDLISLAEGGVVGAQGRNSREDNTRDTEEQRSLDRYLAGYSDKVEALFQSVANHTNGALAFYYRINPEISTVEKGFFIPHLIRGVAIISAIILLLFSQLTFVLLKRVTNPLQKLTKASQDIAAGNYDVQLEYTGHDEVAILTGAFQKLVDHLKVYISDLNSKAYRDAMTGVLNKGAFTIAARKADDVIGRPAADFPAEFGFVMLDCNDLKLINDTYGHEKGDIFMYSAKLSK